MTRGKAEAIGVLVDAVLLMAVVNPDAELAGLEALALLLKPSPAAMAHGACELAERQILTHRIAMAELDALCDALHVVMGDGDGDGGVVPV